MFAVLSKNRSDKLQGLVLIEGSLVKEHAEVLQDDRQLTRGSWHSLEPLDGLRGAQETTRRVSCNLRSLYIVSRIEELLKLISVEVVCTWQTGS